MVVASAPEGGLKTGYARIRADSGPTPAGLAIHGIRHEGVLVSEAVVPAVQLISSGRALARIGSSTRTGIAIANPNTAPVMVAFHFTNASGQDFGRSSFVIPGGGQASHFLHEAPFHGAETPDGVLDGTLTFYASHPVAVTILSVTLGARGAPLSSVMPVASLDNTTAEATFPHWAHGGGWSTEFALVNPSDQVIRGVVEARYSDGQVRHRLLYTIAPRSSGRVSLPFQEATVRIGSARIVPAQGPAPSGAAVIRFSSGGETTTESAVAAIPSSRAFRGYGELFSGRRTGLAVANTSSSNAAVTIELTPMDGSRPSFIGMITLPPFGQRSLFLDEVPGLGAVQSFLGIVRISSPAFVVATLIRTRINERGDFLIAASPPKEESAPSFNAQLFFPLIAAGEGSETEFVLWNVRGLVPASGELMFVAPDGGPLPLSVLPVSGP
jgi:hypothetical protein